MIDDVAKAHTLVERMKAEGVEDTAIETSSVSLYPIRTYDHAYALALRPPGDRVAAVGL